jgi:hypothetical protein
LFLIAALAVLSPLLTNLLLPAGQDGTPSPATTADQPDPSIPASLRLPPTTGVTPDPANAIPAAAAPLPSPGAAAPDAIEAAVSAVTQPMPATQPSAP